MNHKTFKLGVLLLGGLFFVMAGWAQAYTIEDLPATVNQGDFVLGPGKMEINLDPGAATERSLIITNRLGRRMGFTVAIEDITSATDPKQVVTLLGEEPGPYSIWDLVKPEVTEFILEQGQRINLSVYITIPQEFEPGGHYGSVVIATAPELTENTPPAMAAGLPAGRHGAVLPVVSRLANLMFIRVNGAVLEGGALKSFQVSKSLVLGAKADFLINFNNSGNIHLVPYGLITINNMLGHKVAELEVDPYFALPQAERWREVSWRPALAFGHYTARLQLNRGYQDTIDRQAVGFWVVPLEEIWLPVVISLAVLMTLWLIARRFEVKIKIQTKS